jgi:hypothetical protein
MGRVSWRSTMRRHELRQEPWHGETETRGGAET